MLTRLFLISFLFCSCANTRMVQTSLYFGQSKLDGSVVTNTEWNYFVENHIGKVFPEGCTIAETHGNWYDTAQRKIVAEPSKVVTAIFKYSSTQAKQIDSLRYWYKQLYQQQSVLRVDNTVKARLF